MAEAKLNREYALRILGVGALMFGMCVWSVYDGYVGWPRQNRSLVRVRPALLATNLTAEAWVGRDEDGSSPLDAAFRAVGAKTPAKLVKKIGELKISEKVLDRDSLYVAQAKQLRKVLEGAVYSSHDLQTQSVQAVVTFVLGLLAWSAVAAKARKRFYADEKGLNGSGFGNQTFAYSDIARIDWVKWDEKGIVTLTLKSGQSHTLDGWHFEGITGIVEEIKRHRPELAPKAEHA